MAKRYLNETVLAFGDTHFPYEHKHCLQFLAEVADAFQPDRVIHMGDINDIYSISAYPTDIDHPHSWHKEIKEARKRVAQLAEMFPVMDVLESNHDDRAYRKARVAGIPREYLIPYSEVIGAPEGWKWHDELSITVDSTREQLYFAHTKTGGSLNLVKDLRMTSTIGHEHTKFGCQAYSPLKNKVFWACNTGGLISGKGSPFAYTRGHRSKPIGGCIIFKHGLPQPVLI